MASSGGETGRPVGENIADGILGLMALINLIAITLLAPVAMRLIKDYSRQRRAGKDPVFTRDLMPDVANIECWEDERSVTGTIGLISEGVRDRKHRARFGGTGGDGAD